MKKTVTYYDIPLMLWQLAMIILLFLIVYAIIKFVRKKN